MDKILLTLAVNLVNKAPHEQIKSLLLEIISLKKQDNSLIGNWHPLGFIHANLGHIDGIGTIRLHIWLPNKRKTQNPSFPIHDHVFTVNSHILSGSVTNRIYQIEEDLINSTHKLYTVKYDNNKSILQSLNQKINCQFISEESFTSGQYYSVNSNVFHSSEVNKNQFASTLVLTNNYINGEPKVVGELFLNDIYTYERSLCESVEFLEIIASLEQKLKLSKQLFIN
ncbi:hypothetical protein L2D08_07600 [Domibacillus sp. PGB-M46]|uniref:hypothetical protein n=1 Tax=Domibacillus sp. PGB-M46 TaxID=2910255 RepID=UPI001F57A86D|nr:hypothetical protein [Domibacillus sp. PGB-M46]MCI2254225.1 hypothetical protein [Domibacillus sp. PGB-M46]